jgi:exopolysaccharide biosynthesis polyprenyl glycosylphosphotransferase
MVMDLYDLKVAKTEVDTIGTFPVLTFYTVSFSPLELALKRILDIVGAIVGLLITGLVCIFVIPAIKLESPGPVFFSQYRVGRNGRKFKFYKFRSMYQDAEERKKELMKYNEMKGYMFKMKDDPRITKVGKFLRNTSLDELPQFWNVLKGDMSLVGTRPPTVDEVEHYETYHRRRISIKPGLTGMWQVSGRSDIDDFEEVVKLDVEYIDNWSIWLDIKILFMTVFAVLKRKGSR